MPRLLPARLLAATALALAPAPAVGQDGPAFEANLALGRGINLGNALEAPSEGDWGMVLQEDFFRRIKGAGFDSVRIPIRWSAHADRQPPFEIDPEFFDRVDWAIDQAQANGLAAVVNLHHYDELYDDHGGHRERFLALWRQIAERSKDRPETVLFELLNEPRDPLDADAWNALFPEALAVVRESNPGRIVIVGPDFWNNVERLDRLELPEDDRRLIVTFHYYLPFPFTHQGAEWVDDSDRWLGTTWDGTDQQRKAIADHFDAAAEWARERGRPLYVGEFGAYSRADQQSRVRWTAAVAREAERLGFSWAYWEFGSGFGAFDRSEGRWREDLLSALIPRDEE